MFHKHKRNGLSSLHHACLKNNVQTVSQLLNETQIDINRPVKSSATSHLSGLTPLHLVLSSNSDDDVARLAIVDLLLNYGADVNAKDPQGETPLHYAVRLKGKEKSNILKKILGAGADVNAYRTSGGIPSVTALDHLLLLENYSAEQLELFVKHGAQINGYNPLDEGGYLAMAFVSYGNKSEKKKILFNAMRKYPRTIESDEQGRTVIHSLVAHFGTSLDVNEYVEVIDELTEMARCNVNDQDKKGRTALSWAARHANECTI